MQRVVIACWQQTSFRIPSVTQHSQLCFTLNPRYGRGLHFSSQNPVQAEAPAVLEEQEPKHLAVVLPEGTSAGPPPEQLEERSLPRPPRITPGGVNPDEPDATPHILAVAPPTAQPHYDNRKRSTELGGKDTGGNALVETAHPNTLPVLCHGCGAFAQTQNPFVAGYFNLQRKAVRAYMEQPSVKRTLRKSKSQVDEALKAVDTEALSKLGIDISEIIGMNRAANPNSVENTTLEKPPTPPTPPICDRCHRLLYDSRGTPIFHPDVEALAETIWESPFAKNHVYHVVDAADFPMSVLPRMRALQSVMPLRGRNRRSMKYRWSRGKQIDLNFIINRVDLLAPTQDQVYRLMPYLRETLRGALGRSAKEARLGNVRPVSAKQGWWTRELKEEIWKQGGANWLVGKVNVGKSLLFEAVFPKGERTDAGRPGQQPGIQVHAYPRGEAGQNNNASEGKDLQALKDNLLEEKAGIQEAVAESSFLPPPMPEQIYPPMPLVSALPGTTAQPIRRPFGKARGEVVDLPGLPRSDLDLYVERRYHSQLVLHKRVKPQGTTTVKPGQSFILGGIIRITPREDGPIMLMVNFTPMEEHVTSNRKTEAIMSGEAENPMLEHIGNQRARECIQHAGTFELNTNITKSRAGPLTRKDVAGLKPDSLPFVVLGTDILIEGVGWVEVTAQARRKDIERDDIELEIMGRTKLPQVDVHTPTGKFVASRPCIDGFVHNRPRDWGHHKPKRTRSYRGGEEKKRRKAELRKLRLAAGMKY